MTTSSALVLGAALLLALAAVARSLALFQGNGRWDLVAIWSRVGAVVAVVAALVLPILTSGSWSPLAMGQLSLCLALAMLLTHLLLSWRLGADGAAPVTDVLALVLLLVGGWVIGPDAAALTCMQQMPPFYVQWALFLLGIGAALVSGSAGLMLCSRLLLVRDGRAGKLPQAGDLNAFLRHAMALALVALGSGLAIGVWWAWHALGALVGGDPLEIWMASAWLVGATSLLSWQVGKRAGLWAAGLAMLAAIVGVVGFLV